MHLQMQVTGGICKLEVKRKSWTNSSYW